MIFGGPPKRVTKQEFKRALGRIERLNQDERDEVWMIFAGDMDEDGQLAGVDANELKKRLAWMRANTSRHKLDLGEISEIEKELSDFL